MIKPKVGFYWCASCGGCEEAVVDLAEDILQVVELVDIVFWPCAMDFKRKDVEAMADGEMAACFVNGAVRSSEQCEMAELCRRKSQLLVAFGSCSHTGGIPGLANLYSRQSILDEVYGDGVFSTVNKENVVPQSRTQHAEGTTEIPMLDETVKTLDQVTAVDYYLPGCPPPVKLVLEAVKAIVAGQLPAVGSVLAPDMAMCNDCPRIESKPQESVISDFKRPHEILIDPDTCFLAQGLLCMGPATRCGCDHACINGNMPCTGCLGPVSRIQDYGAASLSAVASLVDTNDADEISVAMDKVPDPAGTFYRYSLPASLFHRNANGSGNGSA